VLSTTPIEVPEEERKLAAWWKFDKFDGSKATDSSGNNIIGTLNGDPQWLPSGGKFGGALKFDGVDDFIKCEHYDGLDITCALTISAWIKLSKSAEDQKIASNQNNISGGYKLGIFSGKAELEVRNSANTAGYNRLVNGGTNLQPGIWYHIVGTYNQGGSIRTYVNAKLDREQKTTSILAASSGSLKIGCEPFDESMYLFNGLMDDIRIYNYALSQADIDKIYTGKELGLVKGGN
jgi:hypothetical protein